MKTYTCKECGKEHLVILFEGGVCGACFAKKPVTFIGGGEPTKSKAGKLLKKVCPECRTRFETTDKRKKYCNAKCTLKVSNRAKKLRETPFRAGLKVMKCKRVECGKEFKQTHPNGRLCGDTCRALYKKEQEKIRVVKKREAKA